MVLFYPNTYAVGMSNLGFQAIYRMFNAHPLIRCERAFLENSFKSEPVRALESGERISQFDVIAISLSFELDILGLIRGLLWSGVPVYRKDRADKDPVLFLGGVVAGLNPSPLLNIMDGLLVGEGETVITRIADLFSVYKIQNQSRSELLHRLSEIPGIYIPEYPVIPVKRNISDTRCFDPQYTAIVSCKTHFGEIFVVEMSRGCPYGCFFCAGHHIYSPCRFFSKEKILNTIFYKNPGTAKIGLEGAGISSHPDLYDIVSTCLEKGYEIALSSVRPDRIDAEMIQQIKKTNIQAFTIAPECGSARLRLNIGKGIKDETILNAIELLKETSIRILKLYYLIGLPGETEADISAIVSTVAEIAEIWNSSMKGREIRLSVNGFVPKPFTEFQWASMNTQRELNRKRKCIKKGLQKYPGIIITPKSSKQEILQGYISLTDEKNFDVLIKMIKENINLDQATNALNRPYHSLLFQDRKLNTPLPWDWIEAPISKSILWQRFMSSLLY